MSTRNKYLFSYTVCSYIAATSFCYLFLLLLGVNFWHEFDFLTVASDSAFFIFISAGFFYLLGSFLYESIYSNETILVREFSIARSNFFSASVIKDKLQVGVGLAVLNIIFVVAHIYFLGEDFWQRSYYQLSDDSGGVADLLSSSIRQVVGILPALALFLSGNKIAEKLIITLSMLFATVYLYGVSTKFVAAALLFYALSISAKQGRLNFFAWFFYVASIILLILTLAQRVVGFYGVLSIFHVVEWVVYDPVNMLSFSLEVLTSSIYITAETAEASTQNLFNIFVELNPLPGSMAGWYQIYEKQRINDAIPFNALGTVYSYGYLFTVLFGFFSAYAFSCFKKAMAFVGKSNAILLSVLFALMLCALLTQYNLRSMMRWLYYSVIFSWFITGIRFIDERTNRQ